MSGGYRSGRPNLIIDSPTEIHTADASAEPILLEMQPAEEAPVDVSLSEARLAEGDSAEMVPMMEIVV